MLLERFLVVISNFQTRRILRIFEGDLAEIGVEVGLCTVPRTSSDQHRCLLRNGVELTKLGYCCARLGLLEDPAGTFTGT